jgi:hypothetical protein
MIKKLFLVFGFLFLVFGLSGCNVLPPGQVPSYSLPTSQCYNLEPNISFVWNSKTYIRIRSNLSIIKAKFNEFREEGTLPDGRKVYSLGQNHRGDNLADFLFILLGLNPADDTANLWDVYIDKAKENSLPDFVKNCKETGGWIPMVEGPGAPYFPPQTFEYQEIENNELGCALVDSVCAKYYLRIEKVAQLSPLARKVGNLTKTGQGETHFYLVYHHNGVLYLKDQKSLEIYLYNPSNNPPPFVAKKRDPSLQLGTLRFMTTTQWTWATPECKPVIYLYPEKPTEISIKLNPAGHLTLTNPPYNPETGWQIVAYPDGTIQQSNNEAMKQSSVYPSLHYEALIEKFQTPTTGWVIKKEDLPGFFQEILPQLGLNEKEAADFSQYWLGRLTGSPYYLVSLLPQEEIERIEPLEFSVNPETFIRIRFYFKDLAAPVEIEPPVLPTASPRRGFTAVEWGGLYKNEK